MKMIDPKEAEQLYGTESNDLDSVRRQGPRVIHHKLAGRTGEYFSCRFITNTMRIHDNDSFDKRDPTSKKFIANRKFQSESMSGGRQGLAYVRPTDNPSISLKFKSSNPFATLPRTCNFLYLGVVDLRGIVKYTSFLEPHLLWLS